MIRKLVILLLVVTPAVGAGLFFAMGPAIGRVGLTPQAQYNQVVETLRSDYRDAEAVSGLTEVDHGINESERDALIAAVVSKLPDQWSAYERPGYQPSELYDVGVGVKTVDGKVLIDAVEYGTPAFMANIRRGDQLDAIDGVPVAGKKPAEVIELLKGNAADQRTLALTVDIGTGERVRGSALIRYTNTLPRMVVKVHDGVLYIRFRDLLDDKMLAEFVQALHQEFQSSRGKITGIILDLRNCPGGLEEMGQKLASVFIREGEFAVLRTRHGEEHLPVLPFLGWIEGKWSESETRALALRLYRAPMTVVVNESTCSVAEALAAALSDHGRATLVGTRTWGKGAVLATREFGFGGKLVYPSSTSVSPKGLNYDRVGLQPQIVVELPRMATQDVQLMAAFAQLKQIREVEDGDDSVPMPKSDLAYNAALGSSLVVLFAVLALLLRRRRRATRSAKAV